MRRLEMPEPLAGARVERDQAVGEQVRARPVGAVVVVGGRAGREVRDPALLVNRQFAPRVDAADVLPRVLWPRLVAELARMRNGVKLPGQLAGDHIVRAQIAGRRHVAFAGGRPEKNEILEDLAGCAGLDAKRCRIPAQAFAQIDDAVGAKAGDRLPGQRIDFLEVVVHAENQPAGLAVLALPVVHPARCHAGHPVMNPELSAGFCIERDQRAARPRA